ncbi:MAG: glycosyltransferase family 4 protein [Gemmatimonadales bacterium]|nr:glycosyltransferase family 4 protein [Gemmatimonadales bacterium]
MLRIGIDATCWANRRGYGRFARETVRAMTAAAPHHQFECFGDRTALEALPLNGPNVRLVEVAQGASAVDAASADGYRAPGDLLRLTRAVASARPDVFFSPSVYTYFPLPPRMRAVVTIHDAIAERFPELTLPSRRARLFWRLKVALAIRQAQIILTVSEYAAAEVARVHGISASRLRVALEAPEASYQPASPSATGAAAAAIGLSPSARWFTYVGGFSPHKHVDVILRALAETTGLQLLLIGRLDGDAFLTNRESLTTLVSELGLADRVHWTGYLDDATVAALHSGAIATLLPSASEGFGLPAVEAAACGTPVIATTESPLPGLLPGGGFFIAPGQVEPLAAAMQRIAAEPGLRRSAGAAALAGARLLSWHRTGAAALAAIEEAA